MYDWPHKYISPKSILLDPRNPRLVRPGANESQASMAAALLDSERVRQLARNIAENGYFPDESVILIPPEGGRKSIVAEGNCRVAICQALLKPSLLKGTRHYRYMLRLSQKADGVKSSFQKIACIVAPSRESVRKIIANKHTKRGRIIWSAYAQGNYFYQDLRDGYTLQEIAEANGVSAGLVRSHIHLCVLAEAVLMMPWDKSTMEGLRESLDDLALGPVLRALNFSFVKENIANFSFLEDGNIVADLQVDEGVKFIMSLVSAANHSDGKAQLTHRSVNDEKTAREFFSKFEGYEPDRLTPGVKFDAFSLISGAIAPSVDDETDDEAFGTAVEDQGKAPAAPSADDKEPAVEDIGPKPPRKRNFGVFLREVRPVLRNEKIDALFEEAVRTSPKSRYSTAFLIRSLLEAVLSTRVRNKGCWDDYITNYCRGHETQAGLDTLLRYALARRDVIPDITDRRSLEIGLNAINSVFRKVMNMAMHGSTFLLTDNDVGELRAKVTPVLAHLMETE